MLSSFRALPVGRVLRFLLGIGLVAEVLPFFVQAESVRVLGAISVTLGITMLYALMHWFVSSFLTRLNRWLGAGLAILPVVVVFALGGTLGQVGAITFIGVSLLLAAIRADAGCEVMSIPAVMFGRRTHLVCLLFSPIDWLEKKIVNAMQTAGTNT